MIDWLNVRLTEWPNECLTNLLSDCRTDSSTECLDDYWLIDWLTVGLNERLTEWMTDWMNDWPNDWLTEWLNDWLTDWMNEWMNEWMNDWMFNDSLIDWMCRLPIRQTDWLTDCYLFLTESLNTCVVSISETDWIRVTSTKVQILLEVLSASWLTDWLTDCMSVGWLTVVTESVAWISRCVACWLQTDRLPDCLINWLSD